MSRNYYERYDQIKDLLKVTRLLKEQASIERENIAKSIEDKIEDDTDNGDNEVNVDDNGFEVAPKEKGEDISSGDDKKQKYRISGNIIVLNGKDKKDTQITSEEKKAFQESVDQFLEEVSDLVDFNQLNVFTNNVEWSGNLIDEDVEFILSVGEDSGIYITGAGLKVDEKFIDLMNKMSRFYEKFKAKWSQIISVRKKANLK